MRSRTHPPTRFILASASPARFALLTAAGIRAIAQPSHFDEDQIQTQDPKKLVQELALGKAQVVAKRYLANPGNDSALILGCDSVLELNGEIYGKPANRQEACERWRLMRSQIGHLYTGHALIDLHRQEHLVECQCTNVHFAPIGDAEIEAYVATGEPLHCAGCFALEGRGGLWIEKIDGCHSNVIGLSLPLLRSMMHTLGFQITDFWESPPT